MISQGPGMVFIQWWAGGGKAQLGGGGPSGVLAMALPPLELWTGHLPSWVAMSLPYSHPGQVVTGEASSTYPLIRGDPWLALSQVFKKASSLSPVLGRRLSIWPCSLEHMVFILPAASISGPGLPLVSNHLLPPYPCTPASPCTLLSPSLLPLFPVLPHFLHPHFPYTPPSPRMPPSPQKSPPALPTTW